MKANGTCILIADAIKSEGLNDVTTKIGVKSAFILVYSLLFIFGLVGNGGVVFAMANNQRLRSARNIFLLNLILTDLLLVLTAVPVTPWYALTKTWEFGPAMCRIMPLSNSCSVFVTSWSLTAISIDKYLHIIDPTLAPVTKRQSLAITLLIWLISALINVPYLLSYELVDGSYYVPKNSTPYCGRFCDETNWQSENSRRLYGTMVMLLQFVIPMSIITYCYFRILRKVSQDMIIQNVQFSASLSKKQRVNAISRKKKTLEGCPQLLSVVDIHAQGEGINPEVHAKAQQSEDMLLLFKLQQRVNYILIGMVGTFICCWLPLTAVNLVKDYKIEPDFLRAQPFLWPLVAHIIAMSLVVWNPVLFFWLTRKQKRSGLNKFVNLSEVVATLSNRFGSSVRRMFGRNRSKLEPQRSGVTLDSEMVTSYCATSRPLIIRTELITPSLANNHPEELARL
ncbi:hypothetical protein KIN20_002753 [Parelaphostrongylus tenuis]|uniref:G-protein coupled receptors family 1 profile domain-containing protein n=1 Tax=Parelaphostrongylus tenuis TaxID=148309 RepID=A0AAD5MP01_PARTN|nr:hypothetical protein KIN20_002753 [Parelaphostrongylus tenuis]